jgi:hypothetical protein
MMTQEDRFDALMKLADFRFSRWQNRRTYEWKMSAGLWAILAGATIYLKPSGGLPPWLVGPMLVMAIVGHAWFWVRTNWVSSEMDIRTAFYFAEHAEGVVLADAPKPGKRLHPREFSEKNGGWHFLKAGVCQFQVCATAFLSLGVFLVTAKLS